MTANAETNGDSVHQAQKQGDIRRSVRRTLPKVRAGKIRAKGGDDPKSRDRGSKR